METEIEIWKDIEGYEGLYQVSNLGNVKSLNYNRTGKEKILKPQKPNKSRKYLQVILSKNGVIKHHFVHRLVWTAFNGKIPDGYEINHLDENPENNRLDNLSLVTRRENLNWGTHNEKVALALTNGKRSKPVIQYDLDGNIVNEYPSIMEVKRQLGFNQGYISFCCTGNRKTAYGYMWKYKERQPN